MNKKILFNEQERREFIKQVREGEEKVMCSSFERLLNKENAQGRAQGKAEAVIELLEDIGEVSESLRDYIMEQTDLELLTKWHKAAARATSIKKFEQDIGVVQL